MPNLAIVGGPVAAPNGLRAVWPVIAEEDRAAVLRVLESGQWCRLGLADDRSEVTQFEHAWADYHDAQHCIAVGNGTIALMCALHVLGVGVGDEVIVP